MSLSHNLISLCSFILRSVAVMSFKKSVMVSYSGYFVFKFIHVSLKCGWLKFRKDTECLFVIVLFKCLNALFSIAHRDRGRACTASRLPVFLRDTGPRCGT